ncbi:hypothetical protein D3C81_1803310 [compost metagenome]
MRPDFPRREGAPAGHARVERDVVRQQPVHGQQARADGGLAQHGHGAAGEDGLQEQQQHAGPDAQRLGREHGERPGVVAVGGRSPLYLQHGEEQGEQE